MTNEVDVEWWKKAVVYQIYPQSFKDSNGDGIGDINGIREKLPYLAKLGIDVIWLTPIYQSPMVDNGYDISDYYQLDPSYGTMAEYEAMLAEAHTHNIKILMDLAVCASSDQHAWFQASKQGKDNQFSDFYVWQDPKEDGSEPNNWGSIFGGGSAWEFVPERGQYYLHLFATEQPDLNWESPELRQAVYANMRFWLDKGVDGFRLDSISLISKDQTFPDALGVAPGEFGSPYIGASNGPRVHEFLQEMNREVLQHYEVMTVGEATRTPVDQAVLYTDPSRKELNMLFQFDHMHVDYGQYGRYSDLRFKLSDLKASMIAWQTELDGRGWNSLYWDNHDQPRAVSRFGNDQPEFREISAKMLATILHFQQGTPFVFQGEEIGMTNVAFPKIEQYRDLEAHNMYNKFVGMQLSAATAMSYLHYKSRDNARTPMQWNQTATAGFTTATPWIDVNPNYPEINVDAALAEKDSIFYYYQKLISLRKQLKVMTTGEFTMVNGDDSDVFSYTRTADDEKLLVIGSFNQKNISFKLPSEFDLTQAEKLVGNYETAVPRKGQELYLRPYEALVYRLH